jgi:hypothetical protein
MRQRLNKRRPRHTEPYARPQRRESLSAKIEASDSATIPLAPRVPVPRHRLKWPLRSSGLGLGGACGRLDRTPCIFNLTPRPLDLACLYGGLTRS